MYGHAPSARFPPLPGALARVGGAGGSVRSRCHSLSAARPGPARSALSAAPLPSALPASLSPFPQPFLFPPALPSPSALHSPLVHSLTLPSPSFRSLSVLFLPPAPSALPAPRSLSPSLSLSHFRCPRCIPAPLPAFPRRSALPARSRHEFPLVSVRAALRGGS